MRGASRAALAAAKDRLAAALTGASAVQASRVGDELFAVVELLDREPALRRSLSDPSREIAARTGLAESLLTGRISELALAQVTGLAGGRWSAAGDLADAAEELAVTAIAMAAEKQGKLD